MSKYITWKVRIPSGTIIEVMAKDSIDAREIAADMFDVDFDDTEIV